MSDRSSIEWTDATWNLRPERLEQPLRWRKPRRIFVNSMSDLFHDGVSDDFIAKVFAVMAATPQHTYQVLTKRHARMRSLLSAGAFVEAVQVAWDGLDDDSDVMRGKPLPDPGPWPLRHVWLGVSVEDQRWADIRIPALLETPAAVRFLSCEPLLGPVDLRRWLHYRPIGENLATAPLPPIAARKCGLIPIDWVIVGGESGHGARPMHPDWARSLRDQCVAAGVPFHFKQHGEWAPIGPLYGEGDEVEDAHMEAVHLEVDERRAVIQLEPGGALVDPEEHQPGPGTWLMARLGEKAAGRKLDGRAWDDYPNTLGAQR